MMHKHANIVVGPLITTRATTMLMVLSRYPISS